MVAVAVFEGSARLVAVMVTTPTDEGAVNVTAASERLVVGKKEPPPLDDQVTPAFVVSLVRVAFSVESCCATVKPPRRGETLTVMFEPPEAVIVTAAEANLVESAWAMAATGTVAGLGTAAGAVYSPEVEMVPCVESPPVTLLTCQVTAVFVVPVTVAANC